MDPMAMDGDDSAINKQNAEEISLPLPSRKVENAVNPTTREGKEAVRWIKAAHHAGKSYPQEKPQYNSKQKASNRLTNLRKHRSARTKRALDELEQGIDDVDLFKAPYPAPDIISPVRDSIEESHKPIIVDERGSNNKENAILLTIALSRRRSDLATKFPKNSRRRGSQHILFEDSSESEDTPTPQELSTPSNGQPSIFIFTSPEPEPETVRVFKDSAEVVSLKSSLVDVLNKSLAEEKSRSNPNFKPKRPKSSKPATMSNAPLFTTPNQARSLRACMVCTILLPQSTFMASGCPNCESALDLKGSSDNINECTSSNYNGTIALMSPERSWVGRYQRLEGYVPGIYAVQVIGTLPEEVIDAVRAAGMRYVLRDGRNEEGGEGEQ